MCKCHILECSLLFDWLNIFYNILRYSTIFEDLVNSSNIVLVNLNNMLNKMLKLTNLLASIAIIPNKSATKTFIMT